MAAKPRPKLIALAGPKGGVGKSVIAANLAVGLAARGLKTILADLDLGGANLQAVLGLPPTKPNLADFVFERTKLAELVMPTGIENLDYLPGTNDNTLGLANLIQWQKLKLLTQIKKLPAEVVVCDLAAGSAVNTIDFFAEAQIHLLVSTPETTSILNAYGFLKSLVYRVFLRQLKSAKLNDLHDLVDQAGRSPTMIGELLVRIGQTNPEAAAELTELLRTVAPALVLNMLTAEAEVKAGEALCRLLKKRLDIEVAIVGRLPLEATVRRSVTAMKPISVVHPDSPFVAALDQVVDYAAARIARLP